MKKQNLIICLIAMFVFSYSAAHSAIVVESIKGEVAVRDGNQWKPLSQGQTLAEGAKISTGVNSTAVLKIDSSVVTIQPLTMMKVYRNQKVNNVDNTHLGLKYGSLNARVSRVGRVQTNFKVSTPVATSSVRGTEKNISHGAKKGTMIKVLSGSADGQSANGGKRRISGNKKFQQGPNDAKPDNLLADNHNQSFQPLFDPNNLDEKPLQDFVNDDSVGSGDSGAVTVITNPSPLLPTAPTSATVNINVQWP